MSEKKKDSEKKADRRPKGELELVMTRWTALSGTAKAASLREQELEKRFSQAMIREAKSFAVFADTEYDQKAAKEAGAEAVWQLGGQGVFSALWNIAEELDTGLWVDVRSIPIRQETVEVCEVLDLNPYYLESAGALLLAAKDGYALCSRLKLTGVPAAVIGHTENGNDRILYNQGNRRFLDRPQKEELLKLTGAEIDEKMKEKIGLFCNVKKEHVLQNLDAPSLYEVPMMMEEEHLAQAVCECLNLPCPEPNLADWKKMLEDLHHPTSSVTIALVGKYVALHDAYLSVAEALKHGGIANRAQVNIRWIDAEELTPENLEEYLHDVDGILVPGGFGQRGTEGKILAIGYARRNKIPYLGLCLGMQLAIVEFARNVAGLSKAASIELDPETPDPVIALMPEQNGITNLGGTLRLGAYPCVLQPETLAHKLYGKTEISERHRHRYEVNNDYREVLTKNGMVLSGLSPDGRIVEMIELKEHPFFVATQAHPEFKSRPNLPHPLFEGFVKAAVAYEAAGSSAV